VTTALTEDLQEVLADQARMSIDNFEVHNTNVFVVLEHSGRYTITAVYGPFRSRDSAKDWGLVNIASFTIMEIMRPQGVEAVGFVLTKPDSSRHDPGQTQIGDYVDPTVVP